jgi:hypothetical protein
MVRNDLLTKINQTLNANPNGADARGVAPAA